MTQSPSRKLKAAIIGSGNITTVDAVNFTFHFVANAENARFARLLLRSIDNAVNVTATIKR